MHKILKDIHKGHSKQHVPAVSKSNEKFSLRQGTVRVLHYAHDFSDRVRAALWPVPKLLEPLAETDREASELLNSFFQRVLENQHEIMDLGAEPGAKTAYRRFQDFLRENYNGTEPRDFVIWENYRQHLLTLNMIRKPTLQASLVSHQLYQLVLANPDLDNLATLSSVLTYKNPKALLDFITKFKNIIDWTNPKRLDDEKIGIDLLVNTILHLVDEGKEETIFKTFGPTNMPNLTSKDFQRLAYQIRGPVPSDRK